MNNPMQMIELLKSTGNPQQMLMTMLKNQSNKNPLLGNVLNMIQNNDSNGLEMLARNLANERGINADEAIMQIKNNFGIR